MRLWLTPEQAEDIARQALEVRPHEVCGLIAGIGEEAKQVILIPNKAHDRDHYFQLDEQTFIQAMFDIERAGLSLLAIYHSHPHGEPIPSPADIQLSNYPETTHLIIGLAQQKPSLAGWEIRAGTVTPVDLYVGVQPPPPQKFDLSGAEKTAIILAAIIAFGFMLLLSLSLLPPAPVIVP